MKLWLLKGWSSKNIGLEERTVAIYGVFSTEEKCKECKEKLRKNMDDHNEDDELFIDELVLDEPTEIYNFLIGN